MEGILDQISKAGRKGSITSDDARSFRFAEKDLEELDFEKLVLGMRLAFEPAESSATQVRPAHDQISAAAASTLLRDQKNVALAPAVTQVPRRDVESDVVSESSWESFPASDPPS